MNLFKWRKIEFIEINGFKVPKRIAKLIEEKKEISNVKIEIPKINFYTQGGKNE